MISDLRFILGWWLALFALGLVFLPLTRKLFQNFFDRGYLFSKVLSILFSSYIVWLFASLKILPFCQETIWLVLLLGLIANIIIFRKKIPSPISQSNRPHSIFRFPPRVLIFVAEELMFLFALIFWSFIRGFQPDIQGLEKFMDFGFVNSILRSRYFPPADMWFAGKSINYYYFGHYITAFLTKLTTIDSAVTYNLMLGTLFAFTFSLTFSLTGNLVYLFLKQRFENLKIKKPVLSSSKDCLEIRNLKLVIVSGLLSAFLISLGANLHPAYYNFKMGVLRKPYCDGAMTYWYPNATRYIGYCPNVEDKTIHEFPSYSFVVSDLHGHVSDIPFVFLFLALCLNILFFLKDNKKILSFACPPKPWQGREFCALSLPIPLVLAIMYMTNQWDYPIYFLILGLTVLWGFCKLFGRSRKTLISSIVLGTVLVVPSILLFLPFQLNFETLAKGIDFVRAHSLFYQLLVLWGAPWFFGLTFLLFLFGDKLKPKSSLRKETLIKLISTLLGVEVEFKKSPSSGDPAFVLSASDSFVLILFAVATFLVIVPEIIYLKDIYIPSYHRANTMFKLTYQSFMMFSVVIGYIFIRVFSSLKKGLLRKLLFILYSLFFILLMVYPLYSIRGYYGTLETKNYKGLYGLKFLQKLYPDDYQSVLWLNQNVRGQPVVLEAVGDSYTDYERISMSTGLPTIQGWLVHEWLWRGSFDEPGKRSSEVQTIYESKDAGQTKELLQKYNVKYVVVGEMERQKYPKINETKFLNLGKKVFESGKTAIYEVF